MFGNRLPIYFFHPVTKQGSKATEKQTPTSTTGTTTTTPAAETASTTTATAEK